MLLTGPDVLQDTLERFEDICNDGASELAFKCELPGAFSCGSVMVIFSLHLYLNGFFQRFLSD